MEPIRYPTVDGKTEAEKIEQIRRYLFWLADQLNMNLDRIERKTGDTGSKS